MIPYKRILRPIDSSLKKYGHLHLLDDRYCSNRFQLVHAYHIIEKDFKNLFDFVELTDLNRTTFSHRIFELILRSCTEFETNCKGILIDNGYVTNGNLNITDYFKINDASKLDEYEIRLNIWTPNPLIFKLFSNWSSSTYASLNWYQDYNSVKHDRSSNFHMASLENLVHCIAGLYIILASQFGHHIFSPYQSTESYSEDDNGFLSTDTSVFSFKFPQSWAATDVIDFDWSNLKSVIQPFANYSF